MQGRTMQTEQNSHQNQDRISPLPHPESIWPPSCFTSHGLYPSAPALMLSEVKPRAETAESAGAKDEMGAIMSVLRDLDSSGPFMVSLFFWCFECLGKQRSSNARMGAGNPALFPFRLPPACRRRSLCDPNTPDSGFRRYYLGD